MTAQTSRKSQHSQPATEPADASVAPAEGAQAATKPVSELLPLPIVGIGASAGALETFEAFFRACPADSGIAYVLVAHLDPSHDSLLAAILQRATAMPVQEAQDQQKVVANHVYVIPPNRELALLNGTLQLSVPEQARGLRMPIDAFFRSLADDQAQRAIGIILSGTATDGTLGLRAILGAGGVCMVQEPASARYDGMPQSAIAAGYATHILPVEGMPALLREITRGLSLRQPVPALASDTATSSLNQILLQVRKQTGHDFSLYKKSTLGRRIERRMLQNNIDDLSIYARYLRNNPTEVKALFKEMLINVTSFFRDPESFVALKQTILPPQLAGKPAGYVFRVWVAACASGEEAYSIAMVLIELMDEWRLGTPEGQHKLRPEITLQIFASDLDAEAIASARTGLYPPNIAQDVTPERLRRFFNQDAAGYRVKKELREMVVFAVQSVIKDPPFSRIDFLSCRNLMIYLEPALQERLIPSFHYALKPGGVLLLSSSESITNHPELFAVLDPKWKFYQARRALGPPAAPLAVTTDTRAPTLETLVNNRPKASSIAELSHRSLLLSYAPASVTTDALGNVLYVHGDTGRYLRPAPGPASVNIVDMARDGLSLELRGALVNAAGCGTPTLNREVSVKTNGGFSRVRFSVRCLPGELTAGTDSGESADTLLLISFEDLADTARVPLKRGRSKRATGSAIAVTPAEAEHAAQLERELAFAKENLQAIIAELQAANEELKSTNEELQSTNEELQSSNEEMETSKEEMQSLNEEMSTVNAEQNARIGQLSDLQNDMKNLLDSTNIGIVFLDHQLRIRRYTREAVKAYPLVATDVGRPLKDIKANLLGEDLLTDLQAVLDTLIPRQREIRSLDGAFYLARIQPYRTLDNVIEGVVLTFTDISESRVAAQLKLGLVEVARDLAQGIVDTVSEALIVLNPQFQVVSASRAFYAHFLARPEETLGRKLYELGDGQWNIPALRRLLEEILPKNQTVEGYRVEHNFPGLGTRRMVLNARRIVTAQGNIELILLAIEPGGAA